MTYSISETTCLEAILSLDKICFPQDAPPPTDTARWWIAWAGDCAAAYAGLRCCQSPENRGLAFLCRAGVLSRHRGNGLQKRLIRVREKAARASGVTELVTYTTLWNVASANSLIACGFRLYNPASRWGGKESLHWRKAL